MDLRVADPLNILDVEAELANVADDLRRGVEGAVDQHVTSRRREQDARDPVSADVVRVAEDGERLLRGVPFRTLGARCVGLGAGEGRRKSGKHRDEREVGNCAQHYFHG